MSNLVFFFLVVTLSHLASPVARAADSQPPSVPKSFEATPISPRLVKLTWEAATDDSGQVSYEIERDALLLTNVVLATSFVDRVKPDTSHTYRVRAIDTAQNKSPFSSAAAVKTPAEAPVFISGVMKWEVYLNVEGAAVSDLTANPKFPNNPDEVRLVSAYEGPTDFGDNYGARISGFITPTESAIYIFFVATDQNGEFWLSSDDNPAHKVLVATEPESNKSRDWLGEAGRLGCPDACENRSGPIRLEAGKRYYTELLYKESSGSDNGAVTMVKEGSPFPATGSAPLGGNLIGALIDPTEGMPSIIEQPKMVNTTLGGPAAFKVTAIGTQPLSFQWQFNGKDIAGATNVTFAITNVQTSHVGDYRVIVSNIEGSAISDAANLALTVVDRFPSVSISRIPAGIRVTFTGALQAADQITGAWADVPGAVSPLDVSAMAKQKFYRSR